MTVRSTAGSTLKVSATAPATFNQAGYEALTFTNIGEITNLGEFGREYTLITHNPIDTRATKKLKGSYNEGQLALELGLDNEDDGQAILYTASSSDNDYYFELTLQGGDVYFFPGKVMSFKVNAGNVDSITAASVTLEVTSAAGGVGVVFVPAV